jgi:hypothetical protein
LSASEWTPLALWTAVIASGLYHGINPGMGWPLAVSAGLMERSTGALVAALGYLALGHLLAMLVALLPFALLSMLLTWRWHIQLGASLLVIGFGIGLLVWRRHPRALVRIPPQRLAIWSFAVAMAHGAGLMLVPIYLGMCSAGASNDGSAAVGALVETNLAMAILVSMTHSMAMIVAGGTMAWLVYRHLGLRLVAGSWFNLEAVWASSLVAVGGLSLAGTIIMWR